MRRGPISIFDRTSPDEAAELRRASWYTPGFSDGLGDRLLMFDNTTASSLELLRFKKEFGDHPAFQPELQRRLVQLADFGHPGVASVRAVKWLGDGDGLALVSNYVAGRRLSELLHEPRGALLALELIRQIVPVLALLEGHGDGVAHGALTADRIVVTPDGQLVMVEHVLGPALAALALPAGRVRVDLGLAVLPGHDGITIGGAADVVQLALIALSLLFGRRVNPAEYPESVPVLLDELRDARPGGQPTPPPLAIWLMRALHTGDDAFRSATEAHEALAELLDGTDARLADRSRPLAFPRPVEAPGRARPRPVTTALPPAPFDEAALDARLASDALDEPEQAIGWAPASRPGNDPRPGRVTESAVEAGALPAASVPQPAARGRVIRVARWVAATIALVAIGEGAFIVRLLYLRPTAAPAPVAAVSVPAPTVAPPAQPPTSAATDARTPAPRSEPAGTPASRPSDPKPAAAPPPATAQIGGVRIVSPIELKVFEDGTLVGSTTGAIAVTAGSHTFDLTNDAAGYKTRQVVQVKGGLTTPVTITPPNGRLSVNATPWAEVFVDGKSVGETPIANLSVAIGEHQILFRHPQLGEQRQTALVKVDTPARVSVTFQR